MINSKIGLTRFTDILKRPLLIAAPRSSSGTAPGSASNAASFETTSPLSYSSKSFFFCRSYKKFYVKQVDRIVGTIFDFYTGANALKNDSASSPYEQVIEMQKQKITELQHQLCDYTQSSNSSRLAIGNADNVLITPAVTVSVAEQT